NLAPSELKKLRNKQRKQLRKAELEKRQAAQAQEKREQHNKSRQQTDPDLEQPTLDELIPEKLERVEDPLEQAIKFLLPLQELAANNIETHLMAFEIYIRKGRTLLMLRSIKRAHRLDPNNPELHSCLVRFLKHVAGATLDQTVSEVVRRQSISIFGQAADAAKLNADFLAKNDSSLPHRLQAARMLHLFDPSQQKKAIALATSIDPASVTSGLTLPNCVRVLEALRAGDLGSCECDLAEYTTKCHERFPYATAFRPPDATSSTSPKPQPLVNHQTLLPQESGQPLPQPISATNKY
ncbi:hypothetical protein QAD02_012399, partial [Eretmocerus hayati]